MSLIQANCKNCGAHLEFDDSEEKYFCSKCGTQYIYERPVTVNIENINIGGAPAEKHADFSFNMLEYATCFTKDEEQAKREWINTLMMFEDAPIDVACKAKIVWIKKQYYPVAFFDVTCTADWNAISYWEHDEQYEVLERHRKLNGEVESRLVTKHRTIVDAVQQTSGTVFPTTHCVRVWPGAEPNSPLSCEILSWIDLDSKCIEVKPGYFDNYEIMPESRKREEVVKDASDYAHEQMYKLAEQEVPGDRYENFKAVSHIEKSEMTKRYVAVYNIKYEYNGKEFLCWISGELSDKSWFLEHPNDSYLQERINGLRNKAERIVTWPWTCALILGPIPLGVIGWGLADAASSNVSKAIAWLFVLAIYVFFIVMRVIAGIRESAATQDLNALISRNDRLKKQVHDLLKNNSLSEESKTASIEKWVLDSDVELQNASATSQVKKKIVITIASCFGALLILVIGVVAFNAIRESKVKAKAIAESKEESRAIAESEAASSRAAATETAQSSYGANNDMSQYKKQSFAGLSFDVPLRSITKTENVTQNVSAQMIFSLPSDSAGVIINAIDTNDGKIDASNADSYTSAMLQSFINNNGGSNMQYFETKVDGKTAPSALGNMNLNGSSYATKVIVFCNHDYSKMYIIIFNVYNPSIFTDNDEAIFNHFIESIKM